MLRTRRPNADDSRPRRARAQAGDLWVEIYGPDTGLVEAVSQQVKGWLRANIKETTGPGVTRKTRYFSLFDYADAEHLSQETPTWCLVHRYAAMDVSEAHVDALQKIQAPRGVRIMVRTRARRGPPISIATCATSNWRDE